MGDGFRRAIGVLNNKGIYDIKDDEKQKNKNSSLFYIRNESLY